MANTLRTGKWRDKFACALRGLCGALRSEKNFFIHGAVAIFVVLTASLLGLSSLEWCLLVLCIGNVFVAEIFNTSIEALARHVSPMAAPEIGKALDMAAGAVLMCSLTAALVGAIVLGQRLWLWWAIG